jgi:cell division septation protein DedD
MCLSPMRAGRWAVAAFLMFSFATWVPADPLILHAHEREKAGDFEASAALLSAWLSSNPGASGSPAVFAGYFRIEQDLPALRDVCRQFLASARGVPGAAPQFDKIARLLDLSGRVEEARNAYLAAFEEGAPESALVTAFLLSYQMNDAESMSVILRKLAGKSGNAELLLRALSDMRSGDRAAARATLTEVADQTGNPELALKALWVLYQADVKSGNPAAGALSRSRLASRFASSPEAAIVAGAPALGAKPARTVVVEMPTPALLDAASSSSDPTTAPAPVQAVPGPAPASPAATTPAPVKAPPAQTSLPASTGAPAPGSVARVSVQAGSFLMRENADDLVSELLRLGFAPVVVRENVQGKDRYKVLAGTGLEAEAATAVLKKLSDDGLRGFVVTDR